MINEKIAVVTGASRGCGRAIAEKLGKLGAKLTVVGSSDDIFKTADELSDKGYEVLAVKADVTKEEEVADLFKQTFDQYGQVDILVNNAGVGQFKLAEEHSLTDFKHMFEVNVQGVFLCSKAVVPHMKERKTGTIITISSDVGRRTIANGSVYTATKYAVQGFSGSLAQELREFGVRVGTVNPGAIDTYFADSEPGLDFKEDWLKVDDIAEAVVYMASAPKHMVVDEIMLHPLSQEYPNV
ncbi:short-chain dehydrogenase [Fictibacillus phosphorivorans]|uniref:Short-chain dehydrogenase n=1 Tax=Fictibacillus phosphorivorans TaxID=1221500 RepID=A0A163SCB8_9BACL|nr:SDR family oxidoreductase [Fictibacillus phosphorivorans]KZE68719.1 short-chain dehydrogenase [Fictibacillus phosphorivorans]